MDDGDEQPLTRRVIGFRSSSGPLHRASFTLDAGVTALYGKNGAGKSWCMKAARDCLLGYREPDTHMIVSIPEKDDEVYWLAPNQKPAYDGESEPLWDKILDEVRPQVLRYPQEVSVPTLPASDPLKQALAYSHHVALVPVGGESQPRWAVWICVDPQQPEIAEEFNHLREIMAAVQRVREASEAYQASLATKIPLDDEQSLLSNESIEALNHVKAEFATLTGLAGTDLLEDHMYAFHNNLKDFDPTAPFTYEHIFYTSDLYLFWAREAAAAFARHVVPLRSDWRALDEAWLQAESMLWSWLSDGLPIPVAHVSDIESIPWLPLEEYSDWDPVATTASYLRTESWGAWSGEFPSRSDFQRLAEIGTRLEAHANRIYSGLLLDAPPLKLQIYTVRDWLIQGIAWGQAPLSPSQELIPLDALSTAEQRWAKLAIRIAIEESHLAYQRQWIEGRTWRELNPSEVSRAKKAAAPDDGWSPPRGYFTSPQVYEEWEQFILLDEPEAALHRAAERNMARGLDALAANGRQVLVATHSPEVLNQPDISLIHVRRPAGQAAQISQMAPGAMTHSTAELGLLPSDLLGIYRVFLLVEGTHDEIVIEALLREELERDRVKIVPMRGGSKLPGSIESQLMFDMSSAHLIAVLDNVTHQRIADIWQGAQERFLTTNEEAAIAYLTQETRDIKGDEITWITQWLARALKKRVHERLTPFGLSAADVIEYLPVEVIAPRAGKDWPSLRLEHEAAKPSLNKPKGLHDFKQWLKKTYAADVSPANIRTAANAVTDVPDELKRLGYRIREISSRRT